MMLNYEMYFISILMKLKPQNKKNIKIISNFHNYFVNKKCSLSSGIYTRHNKIKANISSLNTKKTYFMEIFKILVNGKFKNKFKIWDIMKNTILIVKIPQIYFEKGYKYVFAIVTNNPNKSGLINAIFLDDIVSLYLFF
uniref:Ribosomal protein S8 n=1 Tax=Lotharella vacuolata TaxID=74820 RepID=A0A0H5BKW1_9EUKA|nr:ribosomal protein S8 [Lotharella vacuolata]